MQIVRVRLNQEHIEDAERSGSENPLVTAIEQATGRHWIMTECGSGIESTRPHRQFLLQGDILNLWRLYRATGEIAPCVFYLGLQEFPDAQQQQPEYSAEYSNASDAPTHN